MSEKIAFIYISFQLLLYTRILNSHLHTDEPLASNVVFAGTPPVSLLIFLCFNRNNAMNVEYGCIIF